MRSLKIYKISTYKMFFNVQNLLTVSRLWQMLELEIWKNRWLKGIYRSKLWEKKNGFYP